MTKNPSPVSFAVKCSYNRVKVDGGLTPTTEREQKRSWLEFKIPASQTWVNQTVTNELTS